MTCPRPAKTVGQTSAQINSFPGRFAKLVPDTEAV